MAKVRTFATLWAENATFGTLWKGLNRTPLPQTAPLVGIPRTANSTLIQQANRAITRGDQNRKKVEGELAISTARKPAATIAAPAATAAPATQTSAATAPTGTSTGGPNTGSAGGGAAPTTTPVGFGGGGYSGANAAQLGHASNPGYTIAAPPTPPSLPTSH